MPCGAASMCVENRLHGEPYLHYLTDKRLGHWGMKQKKDYQDRQDAELGESIYIDYMHDPFFHEWTVEQRSEYYNK